MRTEAPSPDCTDAQEKQLTGQFCATTSLSLTPLRGWCLSGYHLVNGKPEFKSISGSCWILRDESHSQPAKSTEQEGRRSWVGWHKPAMPALGG